MDPDRPPNTIQELDRYAQALDTWETSSNGSRRLKLAGYIPLEPGWWINQTVYWFGGRNVDDTGTKLLLTSPQWIATFDWIRSYSQRMGTAALNNFRSGFGQFDSPQNAFLCGQTAIEMQGPWMFSFIEKLNPSIYTMPVVLDRIRQHGDVFEGVLTTRQSLAKALPEQYDLYALALPGHDFNASEGDFQPVEEVARRCVEEIRARLNGPIAWASGQHGAPRPAGRAPARQQHQQAAGQRADSAEKARAEGILIAQEMCARVRSMVRGAQLSAPFGRYEMAVQVAEALGER